VYYMKPLWMSMATKIHIHAYASNQPSLTPPRQYALQQYIIPNKQTNTHTYTHKHRGFT
jgi:hypothetical protein